MKITRIGFGYTKSLGNYENCKLWLEADLEDWEDPSESLNHLRNQVTQELNLPDKWRDLKGKFTRQLQALEATNAALEKSQEHLKKAQEEWNNYAAFLTAHGVDPMTLAIKMPPDDWARKALRLYGYCKQCIKADSFPDIVGKIQEILNEDVEEVSEAEKIAHELDASNDLLPFNEHARGDEYDRIYGNEDPDEPENSYF